MNSTDHRDIEFNARHIQRIGFALYKALDVMAATASYEHRPHLVLLAAGAEMATNRAQIIVDTLSQSEMYS